MITKRSLAFARFFNSIMTVALPLATFLAGGPLFAQESGDWIRPTKTVRELGRPYAAPQYWAAFIMLD